MTVKVIIKKQIALLYTSKMNDKHIIAASGGFHVSEDGMVIGPIVKYALQVSAKPKPKLCWIGTAGGDSEKYLAMFYEACKGYDIEPTHLQLFLRPNVENVREFILSQDIIWVSGGSVANLLAVWRTHGIDEIMREAWEKGIILAGVSAGSICWHVGGTTDSFGSELQPVTNGLAFLPYSNGVHYDEEPQRRPLFQKLIAEGVLPDGYATDDGAALHFVNDKLARVVADVPGKFAYRVTKNGEEVQEEKLDTTLIF